MELSEQKLLGWKKVAEEQLVWEKIGKEQLDEGQLVE